MFRVKILIIHIFLDCVFIDVSDILRTVKSINSRGVLNLLVLVFKKRKFFFYLNGCYWLYFVLLL